MILAALYRYEFRHINKTESSFNEKSMLIKKDKQHIFTTKEELEYYKNASLHEKIKILKTLGLTKSEVSYRLRNDMKFKELTKNGLEDFNTIYNSN